MSYEEHARPVPHTLSLAERERLDVSGVEEVVRFDEQLVVMRTVLGELSVHGSGLKVDLLDKTGGALRLSGGIDELVYSRPREGSSGLWARLWR